MVNENQYTELEKYSVTNPKEICQILTELAKHKALLNLSFNQGQDQCLTSVIGVNAEKNLAYLDMGLDVGFNQRLLAATHLIFSKDDGIKIRWTNQKVILAKLKDGEALKIALPKQLVRMQRREFFRSATHLTNPIICSIPGTNPLSTQDEEVRVTVVDASLGGIGSLLPEHIPPSIQVGRIYQHCKITVPNLAELTVTLSLRYTCEIIMTGGAKKHRLGFEFVDLSHSHQRLIQRYVTNLEREALLLASDP